MTTGSRPKFTICTDIFQMTSRLAEIIPPYHRRGKRAFSAANRWPDFAVFLCPEGHLPIFFVIQTLPSFRIYLAVDFPGLRQLGSSPQIIDQAQDFPEQFLFHGNLARVPAFDVAADVVLGIGVSSNPCRSPESGDHDPPSPILRGRDGRPIPANMKTSAAPPPPPPRSAG